MKYQRRLAYLGLAFILTFAGSISVPSAAITKEEYNANLAKITELNNQIADLNSKTSALAEQANTLENEIAILETQQYTIQAQIELAEAEYEQIVLEIKNIEDRISQNQDIASVVISQYYYNSSTSTIERLASSDGFASYLDNEMRLNNMADTLVAVIKENKTLKAQAEEKKAQSEDLLAQLDTQKAQLTYTKQQQATLLAETRNNESEYQRQKTEAQKQRDALEAEQSAYLESLYAGASIVAGDSTKGGYPYSGDCPQRKDAYADAWAMYICECTSYVAWRVHNAYGTKASQIIRKWGSSEAANAKNWPSLAAKYGVPYGSTPKVGAAAVTTSGTYGHVVWVEAVNGDKMTISQYNYRINGVGGLYSKMYNVSVYSYPYYIYFGEL